MADLMLQNVLQHVVQHDIWYGLGLSAVVAMPDVAKYYLPIVYPPTHPGDTPGLYAAATNSIASIVGQHTKTIEVTVTVPESGKNKKAVSTSDTPTVTRTTTATSISTTTTTPRAETIIKISTSISTTTETSTSTTTSTAAYAGPTYGASYAPVEPDPYSTFWWWLCPLSVLLMLTMARGLRRQDMKITEMKSRPWYVKSLQEVKDEKDRRNVAEQATETARAEIATLKTRLEYKDREMDKRLRLKEIAYERDIAEHARTMSFPREKLEILLSHIKTYFPESKMDEDLLDPKFMDVIREGWDLDREVREQKIKLESDSRWAQTKVDYEAELKLRRKLEQQLRNLRDEEDLESRYSKNLRLENEQLEAKVDELQQQIADLKAEIKKNGSGAKK